MMRVGMCCECGHAVFGSGTEMCVCDVQLAAFMRCPARLEGDGAKSLCAFVLETQRPEDYEEPLGCAWFEEGDPWSP